MVKSLAIPLKLSTGKTHSFFETAFPVSADQVCKRKDEASFRKLCGVIPIPSLNTFVKWL